MRKPTQMQWAEHYAQRAKGCEIDAHRSKEGGNHLDASRYTELAKRYRQMEAKARERTRLDAELKGVVNA